LKCSPVVVIGDFILLNVEEENKKKTKESCKKSWKNKEIKILETTCYYLKKKSEGNLVAMEEYKNDKQGKRHKRQEKETREYKKGKQRIVRGTRENKEWKVRGEYG